MHLPIIKADKYFPIYFDFGSGGGDTKVQTISDTYGKLRTPFVNYLQGQIGQPGPVYSGERTAPITAQETQSLDKVNEYANQKPGENSTINAGKQQIENTLNGNYDPSTSPYYQAVKAQAAQNLSDTQKNIASNSAGGGRYFTGSRIKQQSRAATDSALNLNTILGQQAENERQRQISVLPQALQYGQAEQNMPLQQATALQTLGSLPRTLQQNTDNSALENFYKSNYDYPLSILQLIAGVQTPPTQTATPQNSFLQNATQGGALAALLAMNCWVAAEVLAYGDMNAPKVCDARFFVTNIAPVWFKEFYLKHGYNFAAYIRHKPVIKFLLRPLFELFSFIGRKKIGVRYV